MKSIQLLCFVIVLSVAQSFITSSWVAHRARRSDTVLSMISSVPVETSKKVSDAQKGRRRRSGDSKWDSRSQIRRLFRKAKYEEKKGLWKRSEKTLRRILAMDSKDSHSYLALAKLRARRFPRTSKASRTFANGTAACPNSIHLWQAWAVHEQNAGRTDKAKNLFERALEIDPYNPYTCHAYGLLLERNNTDLSIALWERALEKTSTAALVWSLGAAYIEKKQFYKARTLYSQHLPKMPSEKDRTEVALAAAWLEEKYLANVKEAQEILQSCVANATSSASIALVALSRFEARQRSAGSSRPIIEQKIAEMFSDDNDQKKTAQHGDGRMFNTLASIEIKAKRFESARKILREGIERYSSDHFLLQAAGKLEERMGNHTAARAFYRSSLCIQPSAPCLVAVALLELKKPQSGVANFTTVKQLFEEALLIDPRHGPTYNAYARCVYETEKNKELARDILERGVMANCPDAASLYHGYAQLELALGNVNRARELLLEGKELSHKQGIGKDSPHRGRASFLMHTLGTLELNADRPKEALDVFLEGIQQCGNSSQLLMGAAQCETRLGNVDNARKFFEAAIVNDKRHGHAWHAWGILEVRVGNHQAARKLFETGVGHAPRHGSLWQTFATFESRMGHIDVARELFERGVKMCPKHVSLYQAWAAMELREGNMGDAKALITQALTLDKRNAGGWRIAAAIEKRQGNTGLSKLLLRRGLECCPADAALYKALGDTLLAEGNINQARRVLETGIELDPSFPQLYHSLAELEAMVGNLEGLAKLNKRAAAVFHSNAMESLDSASDAWSSKIKSSWIQTLPEEVTALADRIADSPFADTRDDMEATSSSFLDDLNNALLMDGIDLLDSESL